jgi:hypothetical protein
MTRMAGFLDSDEERVAKHPELGWKVGVAHALHFTVGVMANRAYDWMMEGRCWDPVASLVSNGQAVEELCFCLLDANTMSTKRDSKLGNPGANPGPRPPFNAIISVLSVSRIPP